MGPEQIEEEVARHYGTAGIAARVLAALREAQGPNAPVTPHDMHKAFGEETLNEMAAKAGIPPAELAAKLAQVLPHAVDALTPKGVVPAAK